MNAVEKRRKKENVKKQVNELAKEIQTRKHRKENGGKDLCIQMITESLLFACLFNCKRTNAVEKRRKTENIKKQIKEQGVDKKKWKRKRRKGLTYTNQN